MMDGPVSYIGTEPGVWTGPLDEIPRGPFMRKLRCFTTALPLPRTACSVLATSASAAIEITHLTAVGKNGGILYDTIKLEIE